MAFSIHPLQVESHGRVEFGKAQKLYYIFMPKNDVINFGRWKVLNMADILCSILKEWDISANSTSVLSYFIWFKCFSLAIYEIGKIAE